MCGRSTTHFSQMVDPCTDLSSNNPRTKNLGNGGRPLRGDHGASGCEAGVGCGIKSGVPRASFEPRASLKVRAPFVLRAP